MNGRPAVQDTERSISFPTVWRELVREQPIRTLFLPCGFSAGRLCKRLACTETGEVLMEMALGFVLLGLVFLLCR